MTCLDAFFQQVSDTLPWQHIEDEDIETAKQAFIGDILQSPPMYSAIKVSVIRSPSVSFYELINSLNPSNPLRIVKLAVRFFIVNGQLRPETVPLASVNSYGPHFIIMNIITLEILLFFGKKYVRPCHIFLGL